MRFSTYNVYHFKDNEVIIYNTFSGAVISLSKAFYTKLKHILNNKNSDFEHKTTLLKLHIITPLSIEEEFNETVKFLNDLKLYITFGMTFKCNFRCVYCIQRSNYNYYPTIQKVIIEKSIKWIAEYIDFYDISDVSVDLFGGEPSLTHTLNLYVLERLKERLGEKLGYIQMVTNGYSFNRQKIQDLAKHGVRAVQITIDGPPNIHNRRRPLKNGKGTFDKIVKNLWNFLQEGLIINLLTVVDIENAPHLKQMIKAVYKKVSGYTNKIYWALGPVIPDYASIHHIDNFYRGKEKNILTAIAEAKAFAKILGFKVNDDYHVGTCFREFYHAYLISPDGYLYKCYSTFGNKNYSIGNIADTPEAVFENGRKVADINPWDSTCKKCPYFPICRGGCQYMSSLENNGEYGKKWCDRVNIGRMIKNDLSFKVFRS